MCYVDTGTGNIAIRASSLIVRRRTGLFCYNKLPGSKLGHRRDQIFLYLIYKRRLKPEHVECLTHVDRQTRACTTVKWSGLRLKFWGIWREFPSFWRKSLQRVEKTGCAPSSPRMNGPCEPGRRVARKRICIQSGCLHTDLVIRPLRGQKVVSLLWLWMTALVSLLTCHSSRLSVCAFVLWYAIAID